MRIEGLISLFAQAPPAKKRVAAKRPAAPKGGTAADAGAGAIAQIEKAGGAVRKIAQNSEALEVDFHLQGSSVKDDDLKLLGGLKNVVRIHLGRTGISDAGLIHLKGFSELQELHLENTRITDAGLRNLAELSALSYLNLYGTGVTNAGLEHLKGLTKLKSLYVWQTKVTSEGADSLHRTLPDLRIELGWDADSAKATQSKSR